MALNRDACARHLWVRQGSMQSPDPRVDKLTRRYTNEACAYQELWAPVLRDLTLAVLRDLHAARRILDIGAGTGVVLHDLQSAFPEAQIVALDRAAGMLQLAPRAFPRAVMDATRLAIAAESVDLALLAFVLFHLPEPNDGVAEAHRVLRPGGGIATVTWGSDLDSPAIRIWEEEMNAHGAPAADETTDLALHERVDTPEKMQSMLAAAGFVEIRSWSLRWERAISADHLTRLRTRVGRHKGRIDRMDQPARDACLHTVKRRLAALGPEDFIARAAIVYAMATR